MIFKNNIKQLKINGRVFQIILIVILLANTTFLSFAEGLSYNYVNFDRNTYCPHYDCDDGTQFCDCEPNIIYGVTDIPEQEVVALIDTFVYKYPYVYTMPGRYYSCTKGIWDSDTIDTITKGEHVIVNGFCAEEGSYRITYNGSVAYIKGCCFQPLITDLTSNLYVDSTYEIIKNCNLYSAPNENSNVIIKTDMGEDVEIIGITDGWYKVIYSTITTSYEGQYYTGFIKNTNARMKYRELSNQEQTYMVTYRVMAMVREKAKNYFATTGVPNATGVPKERRSEYFEIMSEIINEYGYNQVMPRTEELIIPTLY